MGFYTYTKNGKGNDLAADFVAWLNSNGVTCTLTGTTLDITDFNGMALSMTSTFFTYTNAAYTHTFTLVTEPGKEMILVQGRQDNKVSVSGRYYKNMLVVNRDGALYSFDANYGDIVSANFGFMWSASTLEKVNFDTTGDIYLVPFICMRSTDSYMDVVFPGYYYALNKVEVPAGTIISDGTKQFISCGLFLFVEYDPATMSA